MGYVGPKDQIFGNILVQGSHITLLAKTQVNKCFVIPGSNIWFQIEDGGKFFCNVILFEIV